MFTGVLAALAFVAPASVMAQSGAGYSIDADWARLPEGMEWNGSISWVTPDGNGKVLVLVRAAPYFRLFTKDGEFVRAWGMEGAFDSPHSVTFDADGSIWATDSAGHLVYKYSSEGEIVMTLGQRGVAGDNTSRDLFNQANHPAGHENHARPIARGGWRRGLVRAAACSAGCKLTAPTRFRTQCRTASASASASSLLPFCSRRQQARRPRIRMRNTCAS